MSKKRQRIQVALDLLKMSIPQKDIAARLRTEFGVAERTARGDVQDARQQLEREAWAVDTGNDPLDPGQTRWEYLTTYRTRAAVFRKQADTSLGLPAATDREGACKFERVAMQYDKYSIQLLGFDRRLPEDELSDEVECQRALVNAIRRSIGEWDDATARELLDVVLEHVRSLDLPSSDVSQDGHGGTLQYI